MAERLLVTGGSGFIGSHLVEALAQGGYQLVNLDIRPPQTREHQGYWVPCDVKEMRALTSTFKEFRPSRVIHLAAKASLSGRTAEDYPDNTRGTKNVVESVNVTDSVKLFVHTSTQYVVKPGVCPRDGDYLEPYTAYGESKALAERVVRENCHRPWSIVRPTNIWGPGHPHFPHELWPYLERRYYAHPGSKPIRKLYGYVTNAVQQILHVALARHVADVEGKVWYIADGAIDNAEWMNGFSLGLSGRPMRRLPLWTWRVMASIGDALRYTGLRCPVHSERLFRLTVDECIPEEMIVKLPSSGLVSLPEGIARTVEWYRKNRPCRPRGDSV